MAAPAFRSSSTSGNVTATSDTITKPSGVASGDILLYQLYLETDLATVITLPSGWAQIRSLNQTGFSIDYRAVWCWKRAGGSEPANYTFSGWASNFYESAMAAFQDAVASGTPYEADDGLAQATSGGAPSVPSVTTLGADRLIVAGYTSLDGGNAVWAPGSSGMAERIDAASNALYTVAQAAAGASGTKTVAVTGGVNPFWCAGLVLAMLPVAGAAAASLVAPSPAQRYAHVLVR